MELTLKLDGARIDKIIKNLGEGRSSRPAHYKEEITPYWEHHLSKINIEKMGQDTVRVSGESGFYFPGVTYSGLDFLNTMYKRYGLMKDIEGTPFDLSIPQQGDKSFGYKVRGKWISSDFLRSIHHARKIGTYARQNNIAISESVRILEIGSGTGIQALVFKLLYKDATYFLVDFPETLALAQVFLSIVLPECKFLFFDDWSNNPELLRSSEYDFVFVPNYAISKLPPGTMHLAINTVSMQEMNYDTIGMYFNELRRLLTSPALFYQSNRNKIMEGTLIEVAKYPYRENDRHVYQGVDEFQKKTIVMRSFFGRIPLLNKLRIPVLRESIQLPSLTVMAKE